jgi:hypothetical protein
MCKVTLSSELRLIEVASKGAHTASVFSYRCRSDAGAGRAPPDACALVRNRCEPGASGDARLSNEQGRLGEDFRRLRAELRRLFGLEAA